MSISRYSNANIQRRRKLIYLIKQRTCTEHNQRPANKLGYDTCIESPIAVVKNTNRLYRKYTHPTACLFSAGLGPALARHKLAELTGQLQLQTMTLTSKQKLTIEGDTEDDRVRCILSMAGSANHWGNFLFFLVRKIHGCQDHWSQLTRLTDQQRASLLRYPSAVDQSRDTMVPSSSLAMFQCYMFTYMFGDIVSKQGQMEYVVRVSK